MDSEETRNKDSDLVVPLVNDEPHTSACHRRWSQRVNRVFPENEEDTPDEWITDQCGGCCYFIPVRGSLASDYGVCSHALSPFDGRVMFEHDGCDRYVAATEWVGTYLYRREAGIDSIEDLVKAAIEQQSR